MKTSEDAEKIAEENIRKNDNGIALLAMFALVALAILFGIKVPVPFQTTGTYTETHELQYRAGFSDAQGALDGLNYYTYATVSVSNDDVVPGTWVVACRFKTLKGNYDSSIPIYVVPGETKRGICQADIRFGEDVEFSWYFNEVPTKKIERTRSVMDSKYVPVIYWLLGIY